MSISKAINTLEAPVKEKHARRIILGTHHEKGAFTFWSYAIGLPLPSSAILSWKFCHVLHKVLRDGHPNVLQDCQRYRSNIRETGDLWGHLHDRYGQLVNIYTKLLLTKISFHLKHPEFPPGLEVTDEVLEKAAGTDVNNIFQLTVEMFDYMDCELKLSESGLPADTLQGHRDRFHEQFRSLKNFFKRASDMLYFKRLIQIPRLPESPPNFLRASALAEHVKPVVVIPEEAPEDEEPENLIEISTAPTMEQQNVSDIFEQTFGPPNGMRDDRDLQIENLKKEIDLLRGELEKIKLEAQRYITQLKAQINSLEAEVEEQRKQKQKALVDNEQLRDELERLQKAKLEGDKSRGLYLEAEKKASATEIRYIKLKEKHNELINTHAELLRKNADTAKQLTVTQQSQEQVARVKEQLAFQMEQVKRESEMKLEDQTLQMEQVKRELESKKEELGQLQQSLSRSKQVGCDLNSQLEALQTEKDTLRKLVSEKECELISTKGLIQEKELLLSQEAEKRVKEIQELQERLMEKIPVSPSLMDLFVFISPSTDYLISRAQAALESVNALERGHGQYLANMADATALVGALAQFAHLTADTIVNGSATSHLAPTDHADKLTETCRDCGQQSLDYLNKLKDKQSLQQADPGDVRRMLQSLLQLGQVETDLRSLVMEINLLDIRQEELGDMVDKEMASTSAAIEDAVRRIEGAATPQEFYAKNSRWTEGLISASKAVGWGATQLVESADKVVLHTGKYEELIVCSHEIAASTAQLVAASKVKAEKHSRNLGKLQECSRTVNEMAANVVASTKSGQEQVEDKVIGMEMKGYTNATNKVGFEVKVLELEKTLENERHRLGELRRQHYALAGIYNENADGGKPTAAHKPSIKKPPVAQKPIHALKPDHELAQEDGVYQAHVVNF
ncbi:hypothetical protein JD844_014903 [Phrynosoma platyrhinos]|uniref:Huntingtin interacting protein 1 related n=1 Tax=Phrynosoma platyrhinos TaxID=52577 RepID=A0ABQ7T6V9_PHRPL|nr:hypothetical protein JD844_014903 [Phrynosoma platyrhinos]